jgi:two-component system nitrogen regulation sensor histidine kinase NtrY
VVLVLEDLTELLRAQRLAAWREVAQRIAHEIKNPLTPIQLSAQRLRRRLAGRGTEETRLVEECTGTIIQEVDGLKRLVDEFSRFARMPALAPRPTDLRALVEAVLALYHEANPGVTLTAWYDEDLPLLLVDPDQIKRAILNLVDNAVDAVHGGGAVDVRLTHGPEDGRVRLSVTDDGPGITAESRENLFQPYFSTKPTGTGLGLSIVHQIVSDHAGRIWVEEHQPHGTRFVIELPATGIPAAAHT